MPSYPYVNVVGFLVALRRMPPLSLLSGEEERLLFELYDLWIARSALSMSDAYELRGGKSSITAYRYLLGLKEKGLVEITVDARDKRKRVVSFTPVAHELFASLL